MATVSCLAFTDANIYFFANKDKKVVLSQGTTSGNAVNINNTKPLANTGSCQKRIDKCIFLLLASSPMELESMSLPI